MRRYFTLRVAAACLLCVSSDVQASVGLKAETITPTFSYPGVGHLSFRLRMRTGSTQEQFRLRVEPPRYGRTGRPEGSPIRYEPLLGRPFQSDGPGSVRLNAVSIARPLCARALRFHGYEPSTLFFRVDLPRESVTTLTLAYRTGEFAPWPSLSYSPRFVVDTAADDASEKSAARARGPRLSAKRTGVRIALRTTPASSPTAEVPVRTIRRGRRVTVSGRTDPPLARGRLALKYSGPGRSDARLLARVRVDAKGRFRFVRWRPRRPGGYEVWATYRRTAAFPRVLSDYSCPRAFTIR